MMRTSLAVVSALTLAAPAYAADMALKAPPPPAPIMTWTGCYVGGNVGFKGARSDGYSTTGTSRNGPVLITFIPPGTTVADPFNYNGAIGGGQVGCNYQAGTWVFGVEGDWSWTNHNSGQQFVDTVTTLGGFFATRFWQQNQRDLATARGRIGYASGPVLLYATGGAAWARIVSSEDNAAALGGTAADSQTDDRFGWTVGAGAEYMFARNWIARAEYLYVDFGHWTTFTNVNTAVQTSALSNLRTGMHENIGRVGLSYKFY